MYSLRPEDYSDIGQAKVFAEQVQGELAYTECNRMLMLFANTLVESKQTAVWQMRSISGQAAGRSRTNAGNDTQDAAGQRSRC